MRTGARWTSPNRRPAGAGMRIEVIDDLATFDALKASWEALYRADPEARFFLSWDWLRMRFTAFAVDWFVLAAKGRSRT